MLYNPSFAGSTGKGRITSINGVLGINGTTSHYLSYDQFVPKLYGGIGAYFNRSNLTSIWKANQNTGFGVIYSPKFTYNENTITIAPSIGLEGSYRYFNYNLNSNDDDDDDTSRISRGFYGQINSGILINTKKSFFGFTWNDITNTRLNLNDGNYSKFNTAIQAGYIIKSKKNPKRSFSPIVSLNIFKRSFSAIQYDWVTNFNFKRDKFLWGLSTKSRFNIGGMVGYQSSGWKIGLAFFSGERAYNYSNYYELAISKTFDPQKLNKNRQYSGRF